MSPDAAAVRLRSHDHLSRKLFHIFNGTAAALLFVFVFSRRTSIAVTFAFGLVLMSLDLLRLRWPALNRVTIRVLGGLMREEEHRHPSAQLYYVLGLFFAFGLLPKIIALQAVLTLAWLDPLASMVGVRVRGRSWASVARGFFIEVNQAPEVFGGRTVAGTFAGFGAGLLAGAVAWSLPLLLPDWAPAGFALDLRHIFLFSFVGAVSGAIAEACPSQWDDNVAIPCWTGLAVWTSAVIVGVPLAFV